MENKILILLLVNLTLSCNQRTYQQAKNKDDALKESEQLSDVFIGQQDSIFTDVVFNDTYYSFLFDTDSTYQISWGNKIFTNLSNYKYETLGNGNLDLVDFNEDYILLGQSTGTGGANIRVLLPLKKNSKNLVVENVVYSNLSANIFLIWPPDDNERLQLLNFKSHKNKTIKIIDICPAIEHICCIDSVNLNSKSLEIYYQGSNWKANKPDPRLFKVKLD